MDTFLQDLEDHEKQYVEILENREVVPSRVEWVEERVQELGSKLSTLTADMTSRERRAFYRTLLEQLNAGLTTKRSTEEEFRSRIRRVVMGRFLSLYERHQFTYRGN